MSDLKAPMFEAKVIINPEAGAGSARRKWPHIQECLRGAGLAFAWEFSQGRGHAIELAREAISAGYRYLVAVGGDGTINEVANGILQSADSGKVVLGVISVGTGNDFTRSAGVPRDYMRVCSLLVSQRRLCIDVGLVEYRSKGQTLPRYFVNIAGAGFDAAVLMGKKRVPGHLNGYLGYVVGFPETLVEYKAKLVTINQGRGAEERHVLSVMAANGRYCGHGMLIAPQANLGDGLLDVLTIGDLSKAELLGILPLVYRGIHPGHPKITEAKASHITIESAETVLVQADGEVLGECPASFSVIPAALTIVA